MFKFKTGLNPIDLDQIFPMKPFEFYIFFSVFQTIKDNICCPRDCVSRHNGGTRGAPIMPRDTVSRTANEKLVTIVANRH